MIMKNSLELKCILGWLSTPRMVGVCTHHTTLPGLQGKTMLSSNITAIELKRDKAFVKTENGTDFIVTGCLDKLRQLKPLLHCHILEKEHGR